MNHTANNAHWVRECRGHFHVTTTIGDLIIKGDPFKTAEEAQQFVDLLNKGLTIDEAEA